eukprot:12121121-Alexandrium_andersonii.AAC.1
MAFPFGVVPRAGEQAFGGLRKGRGQPEVGRLNELSELAACLVLAVGSILADCRGVMTTNSSISVGKHDNWRAVLGKFPNHGGSLSPPGYDLSV